MNVGLRYGAVTDATDPALPVVKLDGETTAAPTPNYVDGWVPVDAPSDRVAVLVSGGDRLVIGVKQ